MVCACDKACAKSNCRTRATGVNEQEAGLSRNSNNSFRAALLALSLATLFVPVTLRAADAPSPAISAAPSPAPVAQPPLPSAPLSLKSSAALVLDQDSGQTLYGKNVSAVLPIASITKLMTAMVVLDAHLDPNEMLIVSDDDVDTLRGSSSRLRVGATATREEMLRLALMASENRAAAALSRYYPGGRPAFVAAMNRKALSLGLTGTHYDDPTGLVSSNVSTAEDLAALVRAAHEYDKIREFTTTSNYVVTVSGRPMQIHNTNRLVASPGWDIGLSKTGFINEAGRCLVMQATLAGRAVVIVLLDSVGTYTRLADASRIRNWLEVAAGYVSPISLAHAQTQSVRAHTTVRASAHRTVLHTHSRRHHVTVAARTHTPA
jgi:D-alanyl-D-alanine endopeptidase (penicillin-binding protein 7)